ncbi:hypothetical protein FACS18949_16780 [Clostridia bacterium]|nr:hypothetical protein FACS18949_16780 [Clostridia bacterium]
MSYINSGGVVLYVDSTVSPDTISFTKGSGAAQSVALTLNDNTLASVKNGENALTSGTNYTLSGPTLTFAASYLETLSVGGHTLTLNFDPLGVASSGETLTATVTLTVNAAPTPPVITTASGALTSGTVGTAYSVALAASNSPTAWAVTSGSLPDGLSLNTTTGEISGTPTAANTFNFSVTATNGDGASAPVAFSVAIAKGTQAAPTGLTKTDATSAGNDGEITGVTTAICGQRESSA